MPRTLDEILVHSDELAARFENYEPNPGKRPHGDVVDDLQVDRPIAMNDSIAQ